ncbi:AraC family transcriptional regulator [Mucilaginibacter segetis]|uniref:AraC family transcriptional regulator n=1 Tax=Mucilaginibacter segetis TaxID=2793071 RepID=A0A934PRZ3_9SPHI|nr:AraC family transcriptional regulator [Mucilaginibacter segetis]MBK0379699.1 AraC family transcriptional regulator [Mucilaginibacter segetis]
MEETTEPGVNTVRKSEGFNGQRAIVLPDKVIKSYRKSELISNIFITDIGFYPKAKFHYYERESGTSTHILIYCVDGKGWLEIAGKEIPVVRDQYIIIPAHLPHRYGSDEIHPWSIYWMHFKGTFAGQLSELLSVKGTSFCRSITYSEERIKLFDSIYNILEKGYSDANLQYINMCLWHFLSSFSFPDLFNATDENNKEDAIDRSIAFMRENLHHLLSLKQLAEQALISPSHYSALFKKKTGYPPLEYFNHIKIQKACQYLEFTSSNVKEVSYKLGISDPYYFSRLFSNVMGQSPMDFRNRKKHREGLPLQKKVKA